MLNHDLINALHYSPDLWHCLLPHRAIRIGPLEDCHSSSLWADYGGGIAHLLVPTRRCQIAMAEDPITSGLELAANATKLAADILEKKNAEDVRDAAKAQAEADAIDSETKAVADEDTKSIRENISE